ncbi:hypothetical protein FGADI_1474 [Fusarium gaditjirri]|uniref:Amidase domain-containing protein n=1 Tax=Fusarium gaditjirri TaxID=282569 RepID=A0A8H4TKP2_9HYPO|nr:hypothetical protein FGADI_1474 [Fusarium gaditjirri]
MDKLGYSKTLELFRMSRPTSPSTLLSFESSNAIWGETSNPYNKSYTAGGSTGGEGALLALEGRVGIGSDIAGSGGGLRQWCPMARTLNDLTYFTRSIIQMKPWTYGYSCHPLPWGSDIEKEFSEKRNLRVGILRTDGVEDPSPACRRALEMTESALRSVGHEIVEIDPPSPYEALCLASILLCGDGLKGCPILLSLGRYVRGDAIWAGLLQNWHPQSGYELWQHNAKRELYKRKCFEWWDNSWACMKRVAAMATPSRSLLDYTAGVLPMTNVDKTRDQLPGEFSLNSLNGIAQGEYKLYDANAMHGSPVGVQVIGHRLEEKKVLAIMKRIEEAMGDNTFPLLDID